MKAVLTAVAAAVGLAMVPAGAHAQQAPRTTADDVMISLVHGLPGAVADVMVGDSIVINAFQPGSIADITAFRGRTLEDVSIVEEGSGDVLLGPIDALDVPATGSWSLVAHLGSDGQPMITPFENERNEIPANEARLTFRHVANAPALDLVIGGQRPVTNASNGDSASIDLPEGTLADAQIAPTGGAPIVALAALDLAPGTDTVIYAVGDLDGLEFVIQVLDLPTSEAETTTTVLDSGAVTTTTDASTTTTSVAETTTTTVAASTTTTVAPIPTGVATGSPIDGTDIGVILASLAGLLVAGGAFAARRRI
jgi:hypothetical protein